MPLFKVSVPELWARTYEIEANTFQEAVEKYKTAPHGMSTDHDPEYVGEMLDQEFLDITPYREKE